MSLDLSIIIVTWNCKAYLRDCLASLQRENAQEIVVVDNGSTDGTVETAQAAVGSVRVIQNQCNVGFARASNQGLRESHCAYALLLNPDTIVRPGAMLRLVEFMEHHPNAWGAGPALLNGDGTLQRTGVRFPSAWNLFVEALFLDRLFPMTRLFGSHRELYEDPQRARRVDFVQGSCLMVRREDVLEKVGLLDERFFMYFEETDWCRRIGDAGGEVWYVPQAEVVHFGGGEFGHYDERRLLAYHRSLFLFFAKHAGAGKNEVLRVIVAVRTMVRLLVWGMAGVVRPSKRGRAWNAARGYWRVMGMLRQRAVLSSIPHRQ